MGVLDILHDKKDINNFLSQRTDLGDDLLALKRASEVWNTDEPVDVGESGTLYRILQFASWKSGLNKKFITHGTLTERIQRGAITQDPSIVNLSLEELGKLDNGTTQWVTAALLAGSNERLDNLEYHIAMTYEAVDHWREQTQQGKNWEPRYDKTIQTQAETFLQILKGEKPEFTAQQAEDYCFARAFGYITKDEGEKKWPKLHGHETDRLAEMEKVMIQAQTGEAIEAKDHRVIQAAVMWGLANHKDVKIAHLEAVNKTWPQFWEFIKTVKANVQS
jgi:hypothetical protein